MVDYYLNFAQKMDIIVSQKLCQNSPFMMLHPEKK